MKKFQPMKLFYELWQHLNKKKLLLLKCLKASPTPEFINQLFSNWQSIYTYILIDFMKLL